MGNKAVHQGYHNKLKNRLFGILCEYEKRGDWEKYLDGVLIELLGYAEDEKSINYYTLWYKISSLRYLRYEYFRKTIFDCLSLLNE